MGAVFAVALAVWWLEALVIPLAAGRDLGTYLGAYVQLFQSHPVDLGYVLGRTPVAPLVIGGLLQFAGGALAEPVVSLLYAASIAAWFVAARTFGAAAALLTAVVLLAYPGYGILFHELSSDCVFAAGFAAWALLAVRVLQRPSPAGFAWLGLGVGGLTLIRPGNEVLLVLAVVPLVLRASWRRRLLSACAFVLPAVLVIAGWAIHNGVRYDNYTIARGGNATVPFYRAFVTDKIVDPSNGSASRELARAVRRDLLPKEPYRSYGITLHDFFSEASPRMQVDLLALSDRLKGWHSNYKWLRDVGVEAVDAHPATYARGVASATWGLLTQAVFRSPSSSQHQQLPASPAVAVGGGNLPKPSEGEPIPAPHEGGVSTPDGSIYTVWTSPTAHHLVFAHLAERERYDNLHRRMNELASNLPDRSGSTTLAHRLNQLSRWYPPPFLWLVLALAGLALRRPRGALGLVVPALAGLVVIVVSALGLPAEPHYSVPLAPAFVLFAGGSLFAPRRARAGSFELSWGTVRGFAGWVGTAAAAVAAVWAVKIYVSFVSNVFEHPHAPHDLAVFLRAAGKVIHLAAPYAFRADETYAYPPLLAFLTAPLHPAGEAVATLLWTLLSLGAVGFSLWLLGVRDWRCYALAAAYPFTRSAVHLGTVAPLLLLGLAAAWRWRDRLTPAAASLGAAVALKLFLWPLVAWLALTGRIRAAGAAVVSAVVLIILPWAALGFAGLGGYPGLLRHLSDDEASSSYSVVAMAVRAHLPQSAGVGLSLLAGAVLLAAAAWVARQERPEADATVLTLCLAAALAASPIVWMHYFLLLVVPLALTRPRLSWLWFVPFAYYPLGESAWPAGDARKLTLALATTVILLAAAVVPRIGRAWSPRPKRPRPRERSSALDEAPELRA